ncbi:hypothetical protein O4160_15460 [Rhodococcus sp. IEGM 1401]|uniref:hypothetical protein n=1 Tax=unclassified Rhodococcus (in: high G+C Gram-positive bacteria) TaxID=192944 RepID=UPI0022B4210B|nr:MULTISPECIES: hypothetical protein [unclassified Rhodococcus (in: high G+C Gram-positive bacteria)]MCZ4562239.1 hypothetical protein [Rhodococcus sp. IEGM 1401]MDI9922282.1 hypothetical protein [Rhodococcus sp. IEGM 1372]MDV8036752.1 hypothetical protein [Rhodococcus sp. IEGM 1414]
MPNSEAQNDSDTVEAAESCIDIGKPNPTSDEVANAYFKSINEKLLASGAPTETSMPDSLAAGLDEFLLSVPEDGFSKFASAVCNKPLNPLDGLPGPPEQNVRGALTLGTAGICTGLENKTWETVDDLKESQPPMFAGSDPETIPEGDLTGTTYGQYVENNSNYLQAAIDYVCPQHK